MKWCFGKWSAVRIEDVSAIGGVRQTVYLKNGSEMPIGIDAEALLTEFRLKVIQQEDETEPSK